MNLTISEQHRLNELEITIERGLKTFVDVGTALLEIRDSRLYRRDYSTFEDYCRDRWGWTRQRSYYLMGAAEVHQNLSTAVDILPQVERHVRPLTQLEPEQQREAWQHAIEIAEESGNGKITGKIVEQAVDEVRGFNYKRDMRRTSTQDIYKPLGMDACQTPAYAIDPLLPFLNEFYTYWEPAAGEGLLVEALYDCQLNVVFSDILTGNNFFEYEPEEWDCIVTNPPYSIKYQWLERCYELGKPFALLMPVEVLGSKQAQELFEKYGTEIILLNRRINFKMPNKGWEAAGAPFPTAWFTWQLGLGAQILFGKIEYE